MWLWISGLSMLGVFGCLTIAKAMERPSSSSKDDVRKFQIPQEGGTVFLPKRYVQDQAHGNVVAAAFLPRDFLLAFGKRRSNMGGYPVVSEALAVGLRSREPDWDAFRRKAASYLKDANWKVAASVESLPWEPISRNGLQLRHAEIPETPDYHVLVFAEKSSPIHVVAFARRKRLDHAVAAINQALQTYRDESQ